MFGVTSNQQSNPDLRLPRGECRFILLHPEIAGQRCSCQGFWLNKDVPGSSCACGHQACYHEPGPADDSVSREEHDGLLRRVAELESELRRDGSRRRESMHKRIKSLEEAIEKGHLDREEEIKGVYRSISGVYHNLGLSQVLTSNRLTNQDDKIEEVLDKTSGFCDDVTSIRSRLIDVDDFVMSVEERVVSLLGDVVGSRSARHTRVESRRPLSNSGAVKTLSRNDVSRPWTGHIIFLQSASQSEPFPSESRAHQRCRSRGMHRELVFPDQSASTFSSTISKIYSHIVTGREWMPLSSRSCNEEPETKIERLPPEQQLSDLWSLPFLQERCFPSPSTDSPRQLYIALRHGSLAWDEIRAFPTHHPELDDAWSHDDKLDGPPPAPPLLPVALIDDPLRTSKPLSPKPILSPTPAMAVPTPVSLKRTFSSASLEVPPPSSSTKRIKLRTSLPEPTACRSLDTSPLTREII
ncbi:MAG: hypothetical protein M1833_005887 [Piccolia ochrophora]|nr:MAG: hypothetical protein M1833_005887 [Piccolia ochrophora]